MRGQLFAPARQVLLGGLGNRAAEDVRRRPHAGSVGVSAFRREQRQPMLCRVSGELAQDVFDVPANVSVGLVDHWNQSRLWAFASRALPVADVDLAEST